MSSRSSRKRDISFLKRLKGECSLGSDLQASEPRYKHLTQGPQSVPSQGWFLHLPPCPPRGVSHHPNPLLKASLQEIQQLGALTRAVIPHIYPLPCSNLIHQL